MSYLWPTTLQVPARPPKLVYLDLLHWISLAKANTGHADGAEFRDVLDVCIRAVAGGAAVFPLADAIYYEVSKMTSRRHRSDLCDVMERVSRFRVVTSRSVVATHEVEAMLDGLIGPSSDPVNEMDYLDWGVMRAFGLNGGVRITNTETGEDTTAEARRTFPQGPEAFDRIIWDGILRLNRDVLRGPTPEDEPKMRKDGWDPRAGYAVMERRAQQEVEQVARFDADPEWRKGEKCRRVTAAREVLIEINAMLFKGVADRGVDPDVVFEPPERMQRALDSMPSFDVAVTLKAELHRDPNHVWRPNDITDIDALGSTLPYCDIVVTDKAIASHARRTGLVERLGTKVLARLSDLPELL